MSFVYAEKSQINYENELINCTNIYSETKTTLIGAYKQNWSEKTYNAIVKYGFIKCVNVNPKFSVSFAGNDTSFAHKLLEWIYSNQKYTDQEVIDKAFEIHMSTDEDNIEFILCHADEDNKTHITCIKKKRINRECSSAWIGSYDAFRKMQELRTSHITSLDLFKRTVEECKDDSVDGLIICNSFCEDEQRFLFTERIESYKDRTQIVQSNSEIILSGPAETGDFTVHFRESSNEVIIDFYQNNTSVIYTNRYRYDQKDVDNANTKYFLLPIIVETNTSKVL